MRLKDKRRQILEQYYKIKYLILIIHVKKKYIALATHTSFTQLTKQYLCKNYPNGNERDIKTQVTMKWNPIPIVVSCPFTITAGIVGVGMVSEGGASLVIRPSQNRPTCTPINIIILGTVMHFCWFPLKR